MLHLALGVCLGQLLYRWITHQEGTRGPLIIRLCWLFLGCYAFAQLFTLLG